jgi:hypothetical protein
VKRSSPGGFTPLRALALLGFALVGPAALPAGGAELRMPEVRRRQRSSEPLTAPLATALRCAPQRQAPVIVEAAAGASLRPLRRWHGRDGLRWLQVELAPAVGAPRRGWLLEVEV